MEASPPSGTICPIFVLHCCGLSCFERLLRMLNQQVPDNTGRSSVEEILPPPVVRAAHQTHDVAAGVKIECTRFAHELHPGFRSQVVALLPVAGMATRH